MQYTIGLDLRMGGSQHGGIGRYGLELFQNLVRLFPSHTFNIFFHPKSILAHELTPFAAFKNARFISAPYRHYSVEEQWGFLKLLNKHACQLVHFPNFNFPVAYKLPFVITIHDTVHNRLSGHKKSSWLYFQAYNYIIHQAVLRSRLILTVSESSKNDIIHTLNAPSEKIKVIYPGVTHRQVSSEMEERVRSRWLLPRPYLLFVGVLERKKQVPILTQAYDLFIEKYGLDLDLVIVGRVDPHYPEIKSQALTIKNRHRLVFTGHIEDLELAALYKNAYAYISVSPYEGFGLPGIEAMTYGLPILAANTNTYNEVYDNAAIYFDSNNLADIADKIYLLARDPQFYEHCQQKSFVRAQHFSWEKSAKLTFASYQEALIRS